jgi:hypothetical protein
MKIMKTKILKLIVILLILAGCFACGKEDVDDINLSVREITIGSENPIINYSVNNITFTFCLLNEHNKPSTIFNEGENFKFYFKMTNNNKYNKVEIDGHFFAELVNDGFCEVASPELGYLGYPFERGMCLDVNQTYPFYGKNNTYEVIIPWNCEYWGLFLCGFESLNREYLPKGEYSTEIEHEFNFIFEQEIYYIPITFKFNFEIR